MAASFARAIVCDCPRSVHRVDERVFHCLSVIRDGSATPVASRVTLCAGIPVTRGCEGRRVSRD